MSDAKFDAADILPIAVALRAAIKPACQKVSIAGSLRRQQPTVSDIEIVVLPVFDGEEMPLLYSVLDELVFSGQLLPAAKGKDKYKRFPVPAVQGLNLDLFIARPDNYGNTRAIRTGDWEFSKALVTPRPWGLMPAHLAQRDGYLYNDRHRVVPCPTETAYFEALGVPLIDPPKRNGATAAQLVAAQKEAAR